MSDLHVTVVAARESKSNLPITSKVKNAPTVIKQRFGGSDCPSGTLAGKHPGGGFLYSICATSLCSKISGKNEVGMLPGERRTKRRTRIRCQFDAKIAHRQGGAVPALQATAQRSRYIHGGVLTKVDAKTYHQAHAPYTDYYGYFHFLLGAGGELISPFPHLYGKMIVPGTMHRKMLPAVPSQYQQLTAWHIPPIPGSMRS